MLDIPSSSTLPSRCVVWLGVFPLPQLWSLPPIYIKEDLNAYSTCNSQNLAVSCGDFTKELAQQELSAKETGRYVIDTEPIWNAGAYTPVECGGLPAELSTRIISDAVCYSDNLKRKGVHFVHLLFHSYLFSYLFRSCCMRFPPFSVCNG